LRQGLETVSALPVGKGYAQLSAGIYKPWGEDWNAFGRLEAGYHVLDPVALFAYGQVDRWGAHAGAGLRFKF
jgi:hypothetical protein